MQSSTIQLAVALPALIIALGSVRRFIQAKLEKKGLPLPPGPAQIPFLGNVHSIDLDEPWRTYTDWHAKYGNMVYFRLLDQDVVVLGSRQMSIDLLEKRSQIYSDRPRLATYKPFGWEYTFIFTPYGDSWRICRRMFHQTFRSEAAVNFRPMQLHRACQLVINIANNPDGFEEHFATFAVAVALSAAYDYEPSTQQDPTVQIIEAYMVAAGMAATPEKSIFLKLFPFLLHIPDWCPGSSLKHEANNASALAIKATEIPYQYAEQRTKLSHEHPTFSMVSDNLSRIQEQNESDRRKYVSALKNAAVSSIMASEETTSSSIMVFTLAMVLHPHVWKRAQTEIDVAVGKDRLPVYDDRANLPYVDAVIRETLRWHPVAPMGVWHATSSSDVYNGYYIPKGATIVANIWAMSRDKNRFPDPEAFMPERFLNVDGTLNDNEPADFVFGFGRRICPGRYTADASLWSAIVTMLATLDFYPAKDSEGKDVSFVPKWLNGIAHRPAKFPCQLSLRAHLDTSFLEKMLAN